MTKKSISTNPARAATKKCAQKKTVGKQLVLPQKRKAMNDDARGGKERTGRQNLS